MLNELSGEILTLFFTTPLSISHLRIAATLARSHDPILPVFIKSIHRFAVDCMSRSMGMYTLGTRCVCTLQLTILAHDYA